MGRRISRKESIPTSLVSKFRHARRTVTRFGLTAAVLGCGLITVPSVLHAQESEDQKKLAYLVSEDSGKVADIEALLKRHVDPNFPDDTWGSPLCAAAKKGNIPIMEMLLKHGAKVDFGRQTALMCVRDADAARWLIGHGAAVNAHTTSTAKYLFWPETPLQWAIYHGVKPELVLLLLQSGATMDGTVDYNPLKLAIKNDHADLLPVLLEHGANIEAKDKNDMTLLMYAVDDSSPHKDAAAMLLEHGAAVDATDNNGNTALYHAVFHDNLETIRLLLDHHAEMYGKSDPFGTALLLGKIDVIQAFVDHHADINRRDANGQPELFHVVSGNYEVYQYFLRHGADLTVKGITGWTALMAAAGSYGKDAPAIVTDVLAHGIDVNAADKDGDTALMIAAGGYKPTDAYGRQNEIVKILLAHGAKQEPANSKGMRAIDLAAASGDCNAAALLDTAPYGRTAECLIGAPKKLKDDHNEKVYVKYDMFKNNYASLMPMVVATASALPHPLEIPEEAHKLYVQANVTLKAAQDQQEMQSAIDLYGQAIRVCPWYTDAWYNLSLALEKANDFAGAKIAMSYVMGMEPQLANNHATQERQYTLEAEQKLTDQRQQRQKDLDNDADYIRKQIGGLTMYRFWVFGDAGFARCTMQASSQGTCLSWDSSRNSDRVGNGHNGTSLGSVAAVSTANNQVVLSLGTQRFCIPAESAHSLDMKVSWGFSNNQVLHVTDCDRPDQKLYNLIVLPAGSSFILGGDGKSRPTIPGTVQVSVERCNDDACTSPDISFYWYK